MYTVANSKQLRFQVLLVTGNVYSGEFEATMVSVCRDSSSVPVDLFLPLENSSPRQSSLGSSLIMFHFYAPKGTLGGIKKSHCPSVRLSVPLRVRCMR